MIGEVVIMLSDTGLKTARHLIADIFHAELNISVRWSLGLIDVMFFGINNLEDLPDIKDAEPLLPILKCCLMDLV